MLCAGVILFYTQFLFAEMRKYTFIMMIYLPNLRLWLLAARLSLYNQLIYFKTSCARYNG